MPKSFEGLIEDYLMRFNFPHIVLFQWYPVYPIGEDFRKYGNLSRYTGISEKSPIYSITIKSMLSNKSVKKFNIY